MLNANDDIIRPLILSFQQYSQRFVTIVKCRTDDFSNICSNCGTVVSTICRLNSIE